MPGYLETLEPDDLMSFIWDNTGHVLPENRRSERRGYAKTERGISHLVKSVRLGVLGLSIRHTEYKAQSAWRHSKFGRAILSSPPKSGEIMVIDFLRPQVSRNIIVTPDRPDPVLVTQGNLSDGPNEDWLVRDPSPADLELLNHVIECVSNHPPMVE